MVQFQAIQFSKSMPFKFQNNSIYVCSLVLFDPFKELYQVLPLQARVDLGVMTLKLQHYWNLTIRLFIVISGHSWGVVLPLYEETVGAFKSPS